MSTRPTLLDQPATVVHALLTEFPQLLTTIADNPCTTQVEHPLRRPLLDISPVPTTAWTPALLDQRDALLSTLRKALQLCVNVFVTLFPREAETALNSHLRDIRDIQNDHYEERLRRRKQAKTSQTI